MILPISLYKNTDINPEKITTTETDSGLAVVLYVANLVESNAKDLSKNTFTTLLNKPIRCNDCGSGLLQLRIEITKFLHVLSEKYSSVHMDKSSPVHYPSVFHYATNDASEFASSTSQASLHSDDTGDSAWQPSEKESLSSTESTSKLNCDRCQNDKMSVDTDSLVSNNLTASHSSTRKTTRDYPKDNGCDDKPPSQYKFLIPILDNFSIYENFHRSNSYVPIDCDNSEDNGCDGELKMYGEF